MNGIAWIYSEFQRPEAGTFQPSKHPPLRKPQACHLPVTKLDARRASTTPKSMQIIEPASQRQRETSSANLLYTKFSDDNAFFKLSRYLRYVFYYIFYWTLILNDH